VGAGRGSRRRDLPQARLEALLAAHDVALAAGDPRVAKRNARGAVTCHADLVVKEHAPERVFDRLRAAAWPRRLAAGYLNAHRLTVLSVPTAAPWAHVRRAGRMFTLYEDVSAAPRLDHRAREAWARGSRAEQVALRTESARWVALLHAGGVYHGDLKGVNVRVRGSSEAPELVLIDTDRMRFSGRPVGRRRRVKNLAQLAASIPRSVTRTERLRWWRTYVETLGIPEDERAVARGVAAELARKVVVVEEPIE
jgi:hypothetical protein